MMHPDTEIHSKEARTGRLAVYASADIPRGTIVYVKDELDVEIEPAQYAALDELRRRQVDKFSYIEASGNRVVSWDLAKYVNHSCCPNTISTGWGHEVAVEDIPAGAEITDEYGLLNLEANMHCMCGSTLCRGEVGPTDPELLASFWDEQVQAALAFSRSVEQPLWNLLSKEQRRDLDAYLTARAPYRSVMGLTRARQARAAALT